MGNSASGDGLEDDRSATVIDSKLGQNAAEEAAGLVTNEGSLSSILQLSISATGLKNIDSNSLSDPFCVVSTRNSPSAPWTEVGRTEVMGNNLNPQWVKNVNIVYKFEELQLMRFEVYDADNFTSGDASVLDLSRQDFEGYCECQLALIVGSTGQKWSGQLQNGQGTLTVFAEEVPREEVEITLKLKASRLMNPVKKRAVVSPFVRISRTLENQGAVPCFRTEVISENPNPTWGEIVIPLSTLAAGDQHRPLILEVFDYKRDGDHVLCGTCQASVAEMRQKDIQLKLPPNAKKGAEAGTLSTVCSTKRIPSFLDYIVGGLELQFQVAIDYTSSNRVASDPRSLHYLGGPNLNSYAAAIVAIGSIIEFYDHDKMFPVFGFGGRPRPGGPVEHCFHVNNQMDPEVPGVKGILDVYYKSLSTVELTGPTLFSPIIQTAATLAASTQTKDPRQQKYTVLLILTDGQIGDQASTIDAIVASTALPFSIIIVGVGNADFSNMVLLDADDVPLRSSTGQVAQRDIVQFVNFNEVAHASPQAVASKVLQEIPTQVVEYMMTQGIPPGPRPTNEDNLAFISRTRSMRMPPPPPPNAPSLYPTVT